LAPGATFGHESIDRGGQVGRLCLSDGWRARAVDTRERLEEPASRCLAPGFDATDGRSADFDPGERKAFHDLFRGE
jgi:hypothetical protein